MTSQNKKRYVIAVKHHANPTKPEWQERVALVPGVSLVGATPRRMQVDASTEAIEQVSQSLGDEFLIEELMGRTPGS
ncbi:hypothetical protein [Archangium lansingense]|uniref:Uncharacterized protein n=1 Tax=Archangium lansingense TaxID=2995310 RepID=A0ABT4ACN0_9BACT|nr:hypothetical protein [Archangium lansinium]MCY1079428.1 hypothetical protein [Archangium lansinium]